MESKEEEEEEEGEGERGVKTCVWWCREGIFETAFEQGL